MQDVMERPAWLLTFKFDSCKNFYHPFILIVSFCVLSSLIIKNTTLLLLLSRLHITTLIGEDTDLLVLLLYYTKPHCKSLYFRSDKTKAGKVYNINHLKKMIGDDMCSQLLFIHAMTVCDTTSRIFGICK